MSDTLDTSMSKTRDFFESFLAEFAGGFSSEEERQLFIRNITRQYLAPAESEQNDDFFFSIIKPAIASLIRLKDDSAKELRYLRELLAEKQCANEGTEYAVEIIDGFLEGIDDILLNYDVQAFRCENSKFNPRRQSVVKKLIAEADGQARTVAESLGEGYERRGVVISKERVAAYAAESDTQNKGGN